mmetsp:Transcript_15634/g.49363  ORF Transcript_15634/g.49363 Transcript_15634/m.49363 type:complete len:309 (-) Transcript_15634:519-1445(-)
MRAPLRHGVSMGDRRLHPQIRLQRPLLDLPLLRGLGLCPLRCDFLGEDPIGLLCGRRLRRLRRRLRRRPRRLFRPAAARGAGSGAGASATVSSAGPRRRGARTCAPRRCPAHPGERSHMRHARRRSMTAAASAGATRRSTETGTTIPAAETAPMSARNKAGVQLLRSGAAQAAQGWSASSRAPSRTSSEQPLAMSERAAVAGRTRSSETLAATSPAAPGPASSRTPRRTAASGATRRRAGTCGARAGASRTSALGRGESRTNGVASRKIAPSCLGPGKGGLTSAAAGSTAASARSPSPRARSTGRRRC